MINNNDGNDLCAPPRHTTTTTDGNIDDDEEKDDKFKMGKSLQTTISNSPPYADWNERSIHSAERVSCGGNKTIQKLCN